MAFLTILKLDHCTLGRRIIYQEISSTALCKISPFISFHYQKFNLQDLAHLVEIGKIPKVKSAVELFQLWHSINEPARKLAPLLFPFGMNKVSVLVEKRLLYWYFFLMIYISVISVIKFCCEVDEIFQFTLKYFFTSCFWWRTIKNLTIQGQIGFNSPKNEFFIWTSNWETIFCLIRFSISIHLSRSISEKRGFIFDELQLEIHTRYQKKIKARIYYTSFPKIIC